jgi:flagellar biogenesis protein FliO
MFNLLLNTVTAPVHQEEVKAEHLVQEAQKAIQNPSFFRLALAFVGLLVALWIIIWLLRKMSGSKFGFFHNDSSLKVVEKKVLSPKTMLYVVDFNGQKLLVSESSQHVKIKELQSMAIED